MATTAAALTAAGGFSQDGDTTKRQVKTAVNNYYFGQSVSPSVIHPFHQQREFLLHCYFFVFLYSSSSLLFFTISYLPISTAAVAAAASLRFIYLLYPHGTCISHPLSFYICLTLLSMHLKIPF